MVQNKTLLFTPWLFLPKHAPGHFWLLNFGSLYISKTKNDKNKGISDSEFCHLGGYIWLKKGSNCTNNTCAKRCAETLFYLPRTTLSKRFLVLFVPIKGKGLGILPDYMHIILYPSPPPLWRAGRTQDMVSWPSDPKQVQQQQQQPASHTHNKPACRDTSIYTTGKLLVNICASLLLFLNDGDEMFAYVYTWYNHTK